MAKNTKDYLNNIEELHYNYAVKLEFANSFLNDAIKDSIMILFRKIKRIEEQLGKDLFEMNEKEMTSVVKSLKATTIESLQDKISIIERYIYFAMDKELTNAKENIAKIFNKREIVKPLLDSEALEGGLIFSQEEIMYMAENSINAQDGVLLALLFEVGGRKKMFSDLINLEEKDVDFEKGTIFIGGETLSVSNGTLKMIQRALNDLDYYSIQGNAVKVYFLAEGNRVLRGLRGDEIVKSRTISMRIDRACKYWEEKFLNATNIEKSGHLYLLNELLDSGMEMNDACSKVLEHYRLTNNEPARRRLKHRYLLHKENLLKKI